MKTSINLRSYCTGFASIVIAMAFCTTTSEAQSRAPRGPQAPSQVSREADVMLAIMWQAMTVKCPVSDTGSQATYLRDGTYLLGYNNARETFVPTPLTAADNLNGVQFKGLAILRGTAHRTINDYIREWKPWKPESTCQPFDANSFARRAASLDDDMRGGAFGCWPDISVIKVEKREGQWYFKTRNQKSISIDPFEGKPMPSCSLLNSENPFRK